MVDYINIVGAVVILGIMGGVFGLVLAVSAKGLAVKAGQSASDVTPADEDAVSTRRTALVKCSGGMHTAKKYLYKGISDCFAATHMGGGPNECSYGCIGLGSCKAVCEYGALSIREGVAVVDHERCAGCLKCVQACPKGIISASPYAADVNVCCSSRDRGPMLRSICEIGCLGCRICEKVCSHGAIRVNDNLASIDYEKCTGCGDCAEKCPRRLIVDAKLEKRPKIAAAD